MFRNFSFMPSFLLSNTTKYPDFVKTRKKGRSRDKSKISRQHIQFHKNELFSLSIFPDTHGY